MSDISKYTKDIDPYSRQNWEVREAFKAMKREKQAYIASSCWGALHKWALADRPIDRGFCGARSSTPALRGA